MSFRCIQTHVSLLPYSEFWLLESARHGASCPRAWTASGAPRGVPPRSPAPRPACPLPAVCRDVSVHGTRPSAPSAAWALSSWRSRSPPRRLLLHPRTVPSSQPQERLTRACRGPYAGAPLPSRHCPSHGPGVSVLSSLQRRPLLKRLRPLLRADPVARHPEPSSQRQPLNSRSS